MNKSTPPDTSSVVDYTESFTNQMSAVDVALEGAASKCVEKADEYSQLWYSDLNSTKDDIFLWRAFENTIKEFKVNKVYETGTFLGGSAMRFSSLVDEVYTIESEDKHFKMFQKTLNSHPFDNIKLCLGDSAEMLQVILTLTWFKKDRILLFLDAHGDGMPIMGEFNAIWTINNASKSRYRRKLPILVIHDFHVPETKLSCGWHQIDGIESQDRVRLDLDFIQPGLDQIYGNRSNYEVKYLQSSLIGSGAVFILPTDI